MEICPVIEKCYTWHYRDRNTHKRTWFDPYISFGMYCIRRIPCDFIEYNNSMDLPWDKSLLPKDQLRYSSVKNKNIIKYWVIIMIES